MTQAVNPYRFPSPIKEPHLFFGRDQQLRDVLESINRRECVSIIGERRAGKTSLMRQALQPHIWDRYIHDRQCLAVHLNAETLLRKYRLARRGSLRDNVFILRGVPRT